MVFTCNIYIVQPYLKDTGFCSCMVAMKKCLNAVAFMERQKIKTFLYGLSY